VRPAAHSGAWLLHEFTPAVCNSGGFQASAGLGDDSAGNIKVSVARDQDQGAVVCGDGSAPQPVARSRIGREGISEAVDVDIRRSDDDRVLLRRVPGR